MMDIKFYIESPSISRVQVHPNFSGDISYVEIKNKAFYDSELDTVKFTLLDFKIIIDLLDKECEKIMFTIRKNCGGDLVDIWKGNFSIFDCSEINREKCFIKVKPKHVKEEACLLDSYSEKQIIFDATPVVFSDTVGGDYQEKICTDDGFGCEQPDTQPADDCLGADKDHWCLKSDKTEVVLKEWDPVHNCHRLYWDQETIWHREFAETDCISGAPVEPDWNSGWTLIEDNCASTNKSTWWRCPNENNVGGYKWGRTLEGVLKKLIFKTGCILDIKSDFFNINPLGDSPTNIEYAYALENLHNLSIHQKSDIKRKNASNNSSSEAWKMSLEDLLNELFNIFQCRWIVKNSILIIEHHTFFENQSISTVDSKTTDSFNFAGNDRIKKHTFKWVDDHSSKSFKATDITYECGDNTDDTICKLFSTDLAYIENKDNEEKISDEKFVLVANTISNGKLVVINNNLPLSWSSLHNNLFRSGRSFRKGSINGEPPAEFNSWEPYKEYPETVFAFDSCLSFNPSEFIETDIGVGKNKSITVNIYTCKAKAKLKYK